MTVDETAVAVRDGQKELLPELWQGVQRFIRQKAHSTSLKIPAGYGVTQEDLIQCGYLAVVSAVEHFDPERGSFLSVLDFCLKSEFARAGGYLTTKQDPLNDSTSLDAPHDLNGEEGGTLMDTVADDGDDYGDTEEKIYIGQLHEALDGEIEKLSDNQADVIRSRYWHGETFATIAERQGTSPQNVQRREESALERLRARESAQRLSQFLEDSTDYYSHTGVAAFQSGAPSAVEKLVLRRESLLEEWRAHRGGCAAFLLSDK